jgi:hypothetical protein
MKDSTRSRFQGLSLFPVSRHCFLYIRCSLEEHLKFYMYVFIFLKALWRACNLTAFIQSSAGPVVHPFASHHEKPGFNPQGGTYLKPGFCGDADECRLHNSFACLIRKMYAEKSASVLPRNKVNLLLELILHSGDPVLRIFSQTWRMRSRFSSQWLQRPACFTTDIVSCWRGALWRACNLTAFTHSLTGPVGHPFASRHEGPGFNPWGGTYSIRKKS